MIERITSLSAPPVVGTFYLVPTVEWNLAGLTMAWPVFLPLHNDARFFPFPDDHYHPDPRFVGSDGWAALGDWYSTNDDPLVAAQALPIGPHRMGRWARAVDAPIWRRRKCRRNVIPYMHGHRDAVKTLHASYAGAQCSRAATGWVCPHQHWPMGSVAPDEHGVLTCPLHGLQIDATTGVVLSPCQGKSAA